MCNHSLMTSAPDVPQQLDTFQQSPLMQKKSNPLWKVIFILLLIVNLLFGLWVLAYLHIGSYMWEMTYVIIVFPLSFALAIIDIIALFSYIFRHTHGMAKITLYAVVLPLILPLLILIALVLPSLLD